MAIKKFTWIAVDCFVITAFLVGFVVGANAATVTVCPSGCQFSSIQNAVDAGTSGDTITIGPGTYIENVSIDLAALAPPFGGYGGGAGYLSGGAEFSMQADVDSNFAVMTAGPPTQTIISNTGGTGGNYNYWGQSFTVPASETHLTLTGFTFFGADGKTPVGSGTGYLFGSEYTGSVAGLGSAGALASGAWTGSFYDLSAANVTLTAGATYWFYADAPLTAGISVPQVVRASLTLQGAGHGATILDGGGADIALRVAPGIDLDVSGITIRNGASPGYMDGMAYLERSVLINMEPKMRFVDSASLDVNFEFIGNGQPNSPLVATRLGREELRGVWAQTLKMPSSAIAQGIQGFRFLAGDGSTPIGAGTGYLFEGPVPFISAADLPTSLYVAKGAWNGSYYDLSSSYYVLKPGAIYSIVSDTEVNVGLVDLTSAYNCGGGIGNRGSLRLSQAAVVANTTSTNGAGVCVTSPPRFPFPSTGDGKLTLENVLVGNNTATTYPGGVSGDGGGVYAGPGTTLNVSQSTISGNIASGGGGIFVDGGWDWTTVAIASSTISDNNAGAGGGVYGINVHMTISGSRVLDNQAPYGGGGIVNVASPSADGSFLIVTESTVSGNSSTGMPFSGGGGIVNGVSDPYSAAGLAFAKIERSTISDNVTSGRGGGILESGFRLDIINSTISGNSATDGGGGLAIESAVFQQPPLKTVSSSTITNNSHGILNYSFTTLEGTVVATNAGADCAGLVTPSAPVAPGIRSLGLNLDGDGTCHLAAAGDISAKDPKLGPLQDNGGPTFTHLPLPGSPLIDPPFGGYGGGAGYLSGGAEFSMQADVDSNFAVMTAGPPTQTIISNTGGIGGNYNYWGQSFTVPASETHLTLTGFTFFGADGKTPVGSGTGYLFGSEYTGSVTGLGSAGALALGVWTGSFYDLSAANVTLTAGATYWFYADAPLTVGFSTPPACDPGDQRGIARPQDGDGDGVSACDIGAVEVATRITPKITWADPAPITYGTALDATQLNATADVSGSFAYIPAAGTVLDAGDTQALQVTFTPTDTTRYTSAIATVHIRVMPAPTSVLYTGDQIVTLPNAVRLAAKWAGPGTCPTAYFLDANPTTGEPGPYSLGSGGAVSTSGWLEGAYVLNVTVGDDGNCVASTDQATLTVASPGNAAFGGGWYTLSGSGRVNLGFTVKKMENTGAAQYAGQFVLVNNGKWRLKGTLTTYVKTSSAGAATGSGTLYWWNPAANGGLGDWMLAMSAATFTISFTGGTAKGGGTFGIHIDYVPVPPQPGLLPNSVPNGLKGGSIKVK